VPDWLNATVVGAVIAALGYVAKLIVQAASSWRLGRVRQFARLVELQTVLRASRAAHFTQVDLRNRLLDLIRVNHPGAVEEGRSAEWIISRAFAELDDLERDLHSVIRGYTEHALRPLHEAMLAWLESDIHYRTAGHHGGDEAEFAKHLGALHVHVLLWLAKYAAWIPGRPEHSLVFLADEERHGVEFPHDIDAVVDRLVAAREQKQWRMLRRR
jgi:hypothetical protein